MRLVLFIFLILVVLSQCTDTIEKPYVIIDKYRDSLNNPVIVIENMKADVDTLTGIDAYNINHLLIGDTIR